MAKWNTRVVLSAELGSKNRTSLTLELKAKKVGHFGKYVNNAT